MRLLVKQQAPFQGLGSLSERSEPWKGAVFDYGFEFFCIIEVDEVVIVINQASQLAESLEGTY